MHANENAQWVPAAVAGDILNGTVVPATLPSGPVAIWRSEAGALKANGDRCPHRGMRLSHGFVRGESLSCIYHGWRFGKDGACEHIPAHPSVVPPKTINCGPLAVTEQNGVVWVAAKQPEHVPSQYDGYTALRSLVMDASPAAIQEVSKGVPIEGGLKLQLEGLNALLLLNAEGRKDAFVVVLVETKANARERIAASAALERIRRQAEAANIMQVGA